MIELLLSHPDKAVVYPTIPNNGPGPTTLIKYDETTGAGLFGDLDNAGFITPEQIEALSSTTLLGTAVNRSVSRLWVKYLFNGKVVYVPKRVIRTGTSWNNLYEAGFVYGIDGPGAYPSVPSGPVNQLKTITLVANDGSTCKFKVRLISGCTTDPGTTIGTDPTVRNSEWSKLVERTWPTSGIDTVWAAYGSPGGSVLGKESRPTYTEYTVGLAGNNLAYYRGYVQKVTANAAWLPVLELIEVINP